MDDKRQYHVMMSVGVLEGVAQVLDDMRENSTDARLLVCIAALRDTMRRLDPEGNLYAEDDE